MPGHCPTVSLDRCARLYDFASVGYLTLSCSGLIREINTTALRLLGRRRKSPSGVPFVNFIAKPDRRKLRDHLWLCQERGTRVCTQLRLARRREPTLWLELISLATVPDGCKQTEYHCALRDITARLALRESEERLADFFERSPSGLVWAGPDGRIQRVNQAWTELAGCARTDCLQHRLREFFDDRQAITVLLRCVRHGEAAHNLRLAVHRSDGDIRHCLVDADGLWEKGRFVYSRLFVRDITTRVRLEREILRVTENEQRRIGHDLHDDLCQQLTGIEYLSQSLGSKLSTLSAAHAARVWEIAGMVRDAITHTRELARGLAPVHLDAGNLPDALRELSRRAQKRSVVDCRFYCPKPVLNRDNVVSVHLYRIAQEALANAVNHGEAKRVEIRLRQSERRLALAISDDGVGIPPGTCAGSGMGLRVMQYRANVIGGTLTVARNRHGGTSVICVIKNCNAKYDEVYETSNTAGSSGRWPPAHFHCRRSSGDAARTG